MLSTTIPFAPMSEPKSKTKRGVAVPGGSARVRDAAGAGLQVGSSAKEDYLEQIHHLIEEKGYARVVDIAGRLNVSQTSVTNMVKRLDTENLVVHERYRGLVLTDRGREVARRIIRRHEILRRLLDLFGIDEETAHRDVEGMEHHISAPTLRMFDALVNCLEEDPGLLARLRGEMSR